MTAPESMNEHAQARRHRLSVLAQGDASLLAECWNGLGIDPECELVRGPEIGLVALRGRMGGGGAPFNLGEATATRASVRLADGTTGHAMALGRDKAKARLAAVIDALAQDDIMAARLDEAVIAPLEAAIAARDAARAAETAATKVDFFTMVRGDD
ncbi:phosphonate C-P lyase system protein PhnG [Oceaniradius stylonematis]|jgi:alpha-D-ribose 1-methylphosphonate 5-triphosphate synthase subunit PhnG|uniref:phosphonate C-P lyase system protein PhnG n=1 Tax=Oceaniradius stylonematis TaxID=2184161 RepID=UPI0035CF239A